jgi:hypothetical protein
MPSAQSELKLHGLSHKAIACVSNGRFCRSARQDDMSIRGDTSIVYVYVRVQYKESRRYVVLMLHRTNTCAIKNSPRSPLRWLSALLLQLAPCTLSSFAPQILLSTERQAQRHHRQAFFWCHRPACLSRQCE